MLHTHITLLNEQAEHFFTLAKASKKPKETLAFSERGQQLLSDARQIFRESQEQSILVYFEFMLNIEKEFSFESYLEFNIRNNLKPLNEKEYLSLVKALGA